MNFVLLNNGLFFLFVRSTWLKNLYLEWDEVEFDSLVTVINYSIA